MNVEGIDLEGIDIEKMDIEEIDRLRWQHYENYKKFTKIYEKMRDEQYDTCNHEWITDRSDPLKNSKVCIKCM